MIYLFGNSHVNFFTKKSPGYKKPSSFEYFHSIPLGPIIAYNFFDHHYPKVLNFLSSNQLTNDDYIMLIVGEVDCRWHIPFQSLKQNIDIESLTTNCVNRFYKSYFDLKSKGYNVISWGGHPSTNQNHNNNPTSPIFGDYILRNNISKLWNNCIEHLSNENNIPHISIVNDLINDDGSTKMEYFTDYCHLDSNVLLDYVVDKFKEKKLI